MPIVSRLDPPGSLHHVMSHCVEGCRAFREEASRLDMLDRFAAGVDAKRLKIHAWALMDNHFHLLAEPVETSLSVSMQKLLTGFACSYNRRHGRRGHVFDARFRSILVEKETYYLTLLAYIHLNPIKAGIVESLEDLSVYPWTGHSVITGTFDRPWMSLETTKEFLPTPGQDWRMDYRCLVASQLGIEDQTMESGNFGIGRAGLKVIPCESGEAAGRTIRVLGSRDFALRQYERYRGLRRSGIRNRRDQHQAMEEALAGVSARFGISPLALRGGARGKRLTDARRELIAVLQNIQGVTQADAASFLGISRAAISRFWSHRGADSQDSNIIS